MTSDVFDLKDNTKLYEVLGVARTANDDDIKRAYRKLAVLHHPDKNPAGAETFKEINFAHTVLSDPEQRRMYDAKTLRSHIEGTAQKERDPAMDPNVELSSDDLRSFVERLHKQHTSDAEKRREFESKREAEVRRRAEFERRNPDFQMPTVDAVPVSSHHREEFQQFRKTADLVAAMHRAEAATKTGPSSVLDSLDVNNGYRPTTYETTTSALRRDSDPAPPVAPIPRDPTTSAGATGAPMSQRQQMMMKFRAEREAKGMAPTTQPTEQREALAKSAHQFVRDGAKPLYEPDAEVHKQKRSNFDYHTFVQAKYNDGGVVGEAIMSDALKDYSSRK